MPRPRFVGIINLCTKKRSIIEYDKLMRPLDLPCGVYLTFSSHKYGPDSIETKCNLECMSCNGTGGHEEVSGGHKKDCDTCFGSGLDPVLLDTFENSPHNAKTTPPWSYRWTPHNTSKAEGIRCRALQDAYRCKKCNIALRRWLRTGVD